MNGLDDLIDDLVAEQAYLDRALRDAPAERWQTPSPADGWLLRDCIAHLMEFDDLAARIARGGSFADRSAASPPRPPLSGGQIEARRLSIGELLAGWRDARQQLEQALRPLDSKARLPWVQPMSARSFTTARLMECWSHGLDAVETAGAVLVDTDRLRHVAQLGYMTRDFAYRTRGREPSGEPLRVELAAPSGASWEWGPAGAENRITGSASDFCRVVTQRIHWRDTTLVSRGEAAEEFLQLAQAFAGPPGTGRPQRDAR